MHIHNKKKILKHIVAAEKSAVAHRAAPFAHVAEQRGQRRARAVGRLRGHQDRDAGRLERGQDVHVRALHPGQVPAGHDHDDRGDLLDQNHPRRGQRLCRRRPARESADMGHGGPGAVPVDGSSVLSRG